MRGEKLRLALLVVASGVGFFGVYLPPTIADELARERHFNEAEAAAQMAFVNLGLGTIGLMVLVQLGRSMSRRLLVAVAFAVQAVALVCAAFAGGTASLAAASFFIGMGGAATWLIDERIQDHYGKQRGTKIKIRVVVLGLGVLAAVRWLHLGLVERYGTQVSFLVAAGMAAATALICAPAVWKEPPNRGRIEARELGDDVGRCLKSGFVWLCMAIAATSATSLVVFDQFQTLALKNEEVPTRFVGLFGVSWLLGILIAQRFRPRYFTAPLFALLMSGLLTAAAGALLLIVQPTAGSWIWLTGQYAAQVLIETGTAVLVLGITTYAREYLGSRSTAGATLFLAAKFVFAALAPWLVGFPAWEHGGWGAVAFASLVAALVNIACIALLGALYLRRGARLADRDRCFQPTRRVRGRPLLQVVQPSPLPSVWLAADHERPTFVGQAGGELFEVPNGDGVYRLLVKVGDPRLRYRGSSPSQLLVEGARGRLTHPLWHATLRWRCADADAIVDGTLVYLVAGASVATDRLAWRPGDYHGRRRLEDRVAPAA